MAKEKLKKVSLAKEVKAAIVVSLMAIILFGGIIIFSNRQQDDIGVVNPDDGDIDIPVEGNPDDEPIVVVEEKLLKPYSVNAKIERYYFDVADDSTKNEQAIIEHNGKFMPSIAMEYTYNNVSFDVLAAFSGTVTKREVDPLYGSIVHVKNENGLTAIYGSLKDIKVNVGDKVEQGQVIATAGTNTIDPLLSNHLHFALMKDSTLINPNRYFNQKLSSIA